LIGSSTCAVAAINLFKIPLPGGFAEPRFP
jgi:hypothetical protein